MSDSKSTTNGAMWARRGALAVAATAMAFTALVAAPSPASAAKPTSDTDTTISVERSSDLDVKKVGKRIPVYSIMGGGWA